MEVSACRDPRLRDVVDNFLLVCKAVDLLLAVKRRRLRPKEAGDQLLATLQAHLANHLKTNAGGSNRLRPKTHWGFDIAECLMTDDVLIDAFTTERLHLRAKAVAQHCKYLGTYESAVMAGIVNAHVRALAGHIGPAGLEGQTAQFENWVLADKLRYYGLYIQVSDLVFRGAAIGRARGFVGWVVR